MAKLHVYSAKGEKTKEMDLPKTFAAPVNMDLLTQALHVYEDRSHRVTSMVKTRSMVNATGAKMYKQKGTGNARHGDRKAPIFAGGGIAHGPKGVKRILELPRKVARKALLTALSMKAKAGRVVVAEKLDSIGKTKDAQSFLNGIYKDFDKGVNRTLVAVSSENKNAFRSFRNVEGVLVKSYRDLNSYNVYFASLLVLDNDALEERKEDKKATKSEIEAAEAVKPVKAAESAKAAKPAKKTAVKKSAVKAVKTKKGNTK